MSKITIIVHVNVCPTALKLSKNSFAFGFSAKKSSGQNLFQQKSNELFFAQTSELQTTTKSKRADPNASKFQIYKIITPFI